MLSKEKVPNVRRRHAWLHVWVGLAVGWLLYVIFFTGTVSLFREELRLWTWPKMHEDQLHLPQKAAVAAINYIESVTPDVKQWTVELPSERTPLAALHWFAQDEKIRRGGGQRVWLDVNSGEVHTREDSRFFDFVFRFHYELYGLPRKAGRWITATAALLFLVALISGVVTHKKIFTEFFTLRKRKGLRTWLDLHNSAAVMALPFYIVSACGGLLLTMFIVMPWGVQATFDDFREFRQSGWRKEGTLEAYQPAMPSPMVDFSKGMSSGIGDLINRASDEWPEGVSKIVATNLGSDEASIAIRNQGKSTLLNRARGGQWVFDGNTGELVSAHKSVTPEDSTTVIYNVISALHMQQYATTVQRWLVFLCGILGSLMIATGLLMWVMRRTPLSPDVKPKHRGVRLVQILNVSIISGLAISMISAMWANRLTPEAIINQSTVEIRCFFIAWSLCILHSVFRPYIRAWFEHLSILAVLCVTLALYNIFILYPSLGENQSWMTSHSIVLVTDVMVLVIGLCSMKIAFKLRKNLIEENSGNIESTNLDTTADIPLLK